MLYLRLVAFILWQNQMDLSFSILKIVKSYFFYIPYKKYRRKLFYHNSFYFGEKPARIGFYNNITLRSVNISLRNIYIRCTRHKELDYYWYYFFIVVDCKFNFHKMYNILIKIKCVIKWSFWSKYFIFKFRFESRF
jgi:hypothetical protein